MIAVIVPSTRYELAVRTRRAEVRFRKDPIGLAYALAGKVA